MSDILVIKLLHIQQHGLTKLVVVFSDPFSIGASIGATTTRQD